MITLKDFIETCQTGDLLLYSGITWYSWMLEYMTDSPYKYISMVLKDPYFMGEKHYGIYIIEAKCQNTRYCIRDIPLFGTRIVPFMVACKKYLSHGGNIYYRRLICNRDSIFIDRLNSVITTVYTSSYNINPSNWLRNECGIMYGDCPVDNTFWCSALIAYIYIRLGLLHSCVEWSLMKPSKFGGLAKDKLSFINCNFKLEQLIIIDKI